MEYCTRSFLSRNFLHRFAAWQEATKFRRPKRALPSERVGVEIQDTACAEKLGESKRKKFGWWGAKRGKNYLMKKSFILFCSIAFFFALSAQSDVLKIEKQQKKRQGLLSDTIDSKVRYSLTGSLDLMYGFFQRNHFGVVELSLINGIRIKRNRVGIGIAMMGCFFVKWDESTWQPLYFPRHETELLSNTNYPLGCFPLFANYHRDFGERKLKPSVELSAGYPLFLSNNPYGNYYTSGSDLIYTETYFRAKGLFFMSLEAGVTYRVRKRLYINHSFVYKLLGFNVVRAESSKNVTRDFYDYKDRLVEKALINSNLFGLSTKFIF
jgi:hypothetical protein